MKGRYYGLIILALVFFLSPWGCGGGGTGGAGGNDAPPLSTITINPTSFKLKDTRAVFDTQNFAITVKDSQNNPINKASVNIAYIFAAPNYRGTDGTFCVQFYNGSTPVNSPFTAQTNDFGVYNLRVDFYGFGCVHKGNLEASSGSIVASSIIEVNQP